MVEAGKQLKEQLVEAEAAAAAAEQALQREGQRLPNLTHPDVSTLTQQDADGPAPRTPTWSWQWQKGIK